MGNPNFSKPADALPEYFPQKMVDLDEEGATMSDLGPEANEHDVSYRFVPHLTDALPETVRLLKLAGPIVGESAILSAQSVASMIFLGRLGRLEMAGGALALTLANICGFSILMGFGAGLDPILGQAFGAKQYASMGRIMQRGWALLLLISAPILLLWWNAEGLLNQLGQHADVAHQAGVFIRYLIPTLLLMCFRCPFRFYLKAQGLTLPLLVSHAVPTVLLYLPLNFLFVFKLRWGPFGVAMADFATDVVALLLLAAYVRFSRVCEKAWDGFSFRAAFTEWGPIVRLGFPSMLSTCLEWWAFEVMLLLAGLLPRPDLSVSTMAVLFNVSRLCFFLPKALGAALSIRVSNELGANRPARARLAAHVAMCWAVWSSVLITCVLLATRNAFPLIYGSGSEFVGLVASVTPVFVVCNFFDMVQLAWAGALRGSARPTIMAKVNAAAYYVIGIPLALLLAFHYRGGLRGLWAGMSAAVIFQTAAMLVLIMRTDWSGEAEKAEKTVRESDRLVELGSKPNEAEPSERERLIVTELWQRFELLAQLP
ncbi:MATE efflux family protein [Klebsormidium nitens]|uniref:Protein DETOXIFICATION n=1 Tax=Klebsormidium nitens TaxID=105231 RepID=A0A1Y1HIM8_KLENI|nr:MATE efflux family protein [Klebsormidium nitens]|eukprot:GAQ78344.1 MATE efflux family protein [Klebsormidium nitens]